MTATDTSGPESADRPARDRLQATLIAHAGAVMAVGLLSGFGLLFALLEQVRIWPLPALADWQIGSVRGWSAAHVGGILNGVMMIAIALCLPLVSLRPVVERRVVWAMIFTGWANTVFYQFGNLAANRGLSGDGNVHGEASVAGLIAYLPAAVATLITTAAVLAVVVGAFRRSRARSESTL